MSNHSHCECSAAVGSKREQTFRFEQAGNRLSSIELFSASEGFGMLAVGLPVAFLFDGLAAFTDWLEVFGILPFVAVHVWLWLGSKKAETFVNHATQRWPKNPYGAWSLLALILLGLSPFIFWQKVLARSIFQWELSVVLFIIVAGFYGITLHSDIRACFNSFTSGGGREIGVLTLVAQALYGSTALIGALLYALIRFAKYTAAANLVRNAVDLIQSSLLLTGMVAVALTAVALWRARLLVLEGMGCLDKQ